MGCCSKGFQHPGETPSGMQQFGGLTEWKAALERRTWALWWAACRAQVALCPHSEGQLGFVSKAVASRFTEGVTEPRLEKKSV